MWWHYRVAQFWLMINRIIFRYSWTNASTYSRCFSTQIIPENTTNGLLQRFMQPYNPFYEEHYCQCKNAVHLQLRLENYKELHIILHLEKALSVPHLKLYWSLLYNLTEISDKFLWRMYKLTSTYTKQYPTTEIVCQKVCDCQWNKLISIGNKNIKLWY